MFDQEPSPVPDDWIKEGIQTIRDQSTESQFSTKSIERVPPDLVQRIRDQFVAIGKTNRHDKAIFMVSINCDVTQLICI